MQKFDPDNEIRPILNPALSAGTFLRYYWRKDELAAFCRTSGLPSNGSKQALSGVIARFLESGIKPVGQAFASTKPNSQAHMPQTFTCTSVIGSGWRCSQPLRAFFEQELGHTFHFVATLLDFIHNGQGKSLQEAILVWQNAHCSPAEKEIGPQFEYNRHIRNYLKANPGAGLRAANRAWNESKQYPKK